MKSQNNKRLFGLEGNGPDVAMAKALKNLRGVRIEKHRLKVGKNSSLRGLFR